MAQRVAHPSRRARPTPGPSVGVALAVKDLGELADTSLARGEAGDESPTFVRAIMHRVVSTRGFEVAVLAHATPDDIARELGGGLDAGDVAAIWLGEKVNRRKARQGELKESREEEDEEVGDTVERVVEVRRGVLGTPDMSEVEDADGCGRTSGGAGCGRCVSGDGAAIRRESSPVGSSLSSCAGIDDSLGEDSDGCVSNRGGSGSGMSALGRGKFDDLFVEKVKPGKETVLFAAQLAKRLAELIECEGGEQGCVYMSATECGQISGDGRDLTAQEEAAQVVTRFQPSQSRATTAPVPIARHGSDETASSRSSVSRGSSSSTTCFGDDEGASLSPEAGSNALCGFGPAHASVEVLCDGLAICKTGKGLYRTALGAGAAKRGRSVSEFYFEVHVFEDCGGHGMTIGFASDALPLDKQVGFNTLSAGLHSSGNLVSSNGNFEDFASKGFAKNDRVGARLSFIDQATNDAPPSGADPPASLTEEGSAAAAAAAAATSSLVELEFFVNGERVGGKTMSLGSDTLHPAVSLYRTDSKAVMRCCREDWERADDAAASCCTCPVRH